jgi:hypothetical protein
LSLIKQAGLKPTQADTGAVTLIQHFGSAANLNIHLHCLVLAEYRCRYDWRDRHVKDVREGVSHPTCFASPQAALIPLTLRDFLVVHHANLFRRRVATRVPPQQLLLFEVVPTG